MSKSATSVLVFGMYLVLLALGLLIIPNTILRLFGNPPTTEVWVRIVGMLLLGLAYYYIQTARMELKPFFRLSVHARAMVIVFAVIFVLFDLTAPSMILLGVVDLLAAIWTALALRSESEPVLKF